VQSHARLVCNILQPSSTRPVSIFTEYWHPHPMQLDSASFISRLLRLNFPSNLSQMFSVAQCSVQYDPQVDWIGVMLELLVFHRHSELSSCTSVQQMKYFKHCITRAWLEAPEATVCCCLFHVCCKAEFLFCKSLTLLHLADVICVYEHCGLWQVVYVEVEERRR